MTDYETYKQEWEADREAGIITERMFLLPENVFNHPTIAQYMTDDVQFKIVTAARQSYKSEIAKRLVWQCAIQNPNHRYVIGTATHAQTWEQYWDNGFPKMFHPSLIEDMSTSKNRMKLINGSVIQLFAADSAERSDGSIVDGLILDECGDISNLKQIIWDNLMPGLLRGNGFGLFLGVPRQTKGLYYKELFDTYKDGHDRNWKTYTWPAADVWDEKDIAAAKANYDPVYYAINFLGQFADNSGGLAYYRFNKKLHLKQLQLSDDLPLFVSFDFNSSIMTPLVGQTLSNNLSYLESEIVDRNTNVYKIAPLVQKKLIELNHGNEARAKQRKTFLYGDKAGFQKTANARGSAWDELKAMFVGWNIDLRYKESPHVEKRVSSVNARLQSADDKVHMFFNPSFENSELVKDFNTLSLDNLINNKHILKERGHATDALGYYSHYEFPIRMGATYNL